MKSVVIHSPDTDVLVLLLHHKALIKAHSLYFWTGRVGVNTDQTRYIPIHKIYQKLTPEQLNILLSVYCLTGCDTCSSFYGIGKRTAFNVMIQRADMFQGLSVLGTGSVTKGVKMVCTHFVGRLYLKNNCSSLDQLRCMKATNKVSAKRLPPTENSFHQHLLRCCYQLLIWRQCLIASPQLPPPTDYGYFIEEETGMLKPVMMTQSPAAPELLNDLVCMCESDCGETCTFVLNDQSCTIACACETALPMVDSTKFCTNVQTILAVSLDNNDSDAEND